jgi:hypothetical protein
VWKFIIYYFYCSKHGIPKNNNEECELCKAEEETAATLSVENLNLGKRKQRGIGHKVTDIFLNKITKSLLIACIAITALYFLSNQFSDYAANKLSGILPQKQTSAYVLFQMKNIKELQVLKLNKAEFYKYEDEKKRWAELIIRYTISINFNLEDYRIIKNDDGSLTIELKKPEIKPILLDGTEYTEKKQPDYYPGVEIFDISNSWIPGPDFKLGDLTIRDIAQNYIENECNKNLESLTQMALENFKAKLMDVSEKLNVNITDVRLEGDKE